MSPYTLRKMEQGDLAAIYPHIQKNFAQGEYPPRGVLSRHLEDGLQEGFVLWAGEERAAYAACAGAAKGPGYVLISLFAVYESFRQKGVGSSFLRELCDVYENRKGLIVEVEIPERAPDLEERDYRLRRIAFYERAGFTLVPHISYSIWDIPMHLMVRGLSVSNTTAQGEVGQAMYDIYLALMGDKYINKMQFKKNQ